MGVPTWRKPAEATLTATRAMSASRNRADMMVEFGEVQKDDFVVGSFKFSSSRKLGWIFDLSSDNNDFENIIAFCHLRRSIGTDILRGSLSQRCYPQILREKR
jgi:hypothetical protein